MLVQQNPWPGKYTEVGWAKFSTDLELFVAYNDGAGPGTVFFGNRPPTTHIYSSQFDPNSNVHWFYFDNVAFYNRNMNFSWGDRVEAGGEVYDGIESMGRTLLYDLRYLTNIGGLFYFYPWNGYGRYVEDFPYYNLPNGLNSFYDTEGKLIFFPFIFKYLNP